MGKNLSKYQNGTEADIKNYRNSLIMGVDDIPETNIAMSADNDEVTRRETVVEREVKKRKESAVSIVSALPEEVKLPTVTSYIPFILSESIFCGHLVTDLDSIAGAIGAAELYGGIAARASEVNSETAFALQYWGIPTPLPVEELVVSQPNAGICLVDHQQMSQVNPAIDPDRIVGVIDHHALQNGTIVTEKPIYMDIRPWGSMSTIIAHTFLTVQKRPRKCVAGILLCAILSDTLNLLGPTTTDWDRMMVAILCEIAGVTDIQGLAQQQFRAKSRELQWMTPAALCTGDLKTFNFKTDKFNGCIGFAVIETTDDEIILERKNEILVALEETKKEKQVDMIFLAVVNIVALHACLLVNGPPENDLAEVAFAGTPTKDDPRVIQIGGLVSRKKDYIPAITRAIKNGWSVPK